MNPSSLLTLLGAVGGVLQYAASSGVQVPQSKQDWAHVGLSLLIGAAGYLAKGADSGQPAK